MTNYVTWTPAGGEELILSGHRASGVMLGGIGSGRPIALGLDMPTESQFESELAGGDGAIFQGRRALPREVTLPLIILADTFDDLETYRRELMTAFNPRRGAGTLTWASRSDGERRSLECIYSSGLDSAVNGRLAPVTHTAYQLVLRAVDPYWYSDWREIEFTPTIVSSDFFPGPPFFISDTRVFGTQEVVIDSEVETFPEFVLVGPGVNAELTNELTGQTLDLTPNLATTADTLTIRTDPRVPAAQKFTDENGANVWATSAGQFPSLWALQPGPQEVTVNMTGGSTGSNIIMRYRPRGLVA